MCIRDSFYVMFQLLPVRLQLPLKPLPVGNVPQLHHDQQFIGRSNLDQVHFDRRVLSAGMAHHDFLGGHFPLAGTDVAQPSTQGIVMPGKHHFEQTAAHHIRLGIPQRCSSRLLTATIMPFGSTINTESATKSNNALYRACEATSCCVRSETASSSFVVYSCRCRSSLWRSVTSWTNARECTNPPRS